MIVIEASHLTLNRLCIVLKDFSNTRIASSIIDTLAKLGSVMCLEDLEDHQSTFDDPISINYRGIDIWEIPPNGQGITALLGLNILETFDMSAMHYHSPEHLHALLEVSPK